MEFIHPLTFIGLSACCVGAVLAVELVHVVSDVRPQLSPRRLVCAQLVLQYQCVSDPQPDLLG